MLYKNLTISKMISGADKAIKENRLIEIIYTCKDKEGRDVTTRRKVKPSHIAVYQNGNVVVKGYCLLRRKNRKFRLDRISAFGITDPLPRKDQLVMYPGTWELRHACAQVVKNIEAWAKAGWTTKPVILTEPVSESA